MDEFAIAGIDADVGIRALAGVEEHQVAGFEFISGDGPALAAHVAGAVGQADVGALLVDVFDEAAAVHAFRGIVTAEPVRGADHAERLQQGLNLGAYALREGFLRLDGGCGHQGEGEEQKICKESHRRQSLRCKKNSCPIRPLKR